MASSFPGMDPFLESAAWSNFHLTFINYWSEAIADGLPDEYEARLGERVYSTEVDPATRKLIYADLSVPVEIIEGPRETFIEILHRPDRSLVAVLELLSPANKQPPGRTEYLSKRNAILRQNVHLVELDLLLGGQRPPTAKPRPAGDYYYLLARAEQRFDCQVYSWLLPHVLPRLPVPLRAGHADITIDLGQVFTTAYDRGRFGRRLPYGQPCPAPLNDDQRRWVESIVAPAK